MQPNPEAFSTARRPLDVSDFIDIMRRHRGWIIGPAFAGLVISVVVAFVWPDVYVSDGTIRIVPPTVPERYVPTNVNLQLGQRIAAMEQQVRSRSNILSLINEFALYPRRRGRIPDEDLVESMQKDITIRAVAAMRDAGGAQIGATAFRVSFRYGDRYQAQKVVSKIISMFQDETTRTRSANSVQTTDFLKEKLDAAKKSLDEIENRLTAYKLKFQGRLPEQMASNLTALRTLETQLSTAASSLNRATQEKLLLENSLRVAREQFEAVPASATAGVETAVRNDRLINLERQVLTGETQLAALRQRYSASHPDVRQAEAQLASLRQSREAALAGEDGGKTAAPAKPEGAVLTREQRQAQLDLERLRSQIQTKDLEIEQIIKEQARLNKLIQEYQQRIEASPLSERDYAQLTRDHQLAKDQYEDLTRKSEQSTMATELEIRKQGELLEVLEQASLPQTPSEPNRWLVIAVGSLFGLALGFLLTGVREVKDTSLKSLKDVRIYTGLPVLGSVPLVENDLLVQRKRRLAWVAWSSASIVGFLLMLGSVFYYYTKGA